ncbi:MAG: MBL fold metallo-hydrolase [Actinobacteria bacterium]|nr:MBL fold metallo-hydrolase [Actinomycetota bacterium]MCB9390194.1 MBL fold metallo-hydrolase [Acidimicrobiia bacterium]
MIVHHLNCGTIRLPGVNLVCHVLVVECADRLVLVDSGFGMADVTHPRQRLGALSPIMGRHLSESTTAIRQIERLGHSADDVRDIVLTHLDVDHIGGISDFPHARVHTSAAEVLAAITRPNLKAKFRFGAARRDYSDRFVEHTPDGEAWMGFAAAKELTDISPGIVMIPLAGHTSGHVAVGIETEGRWLIHAGDAFFHRGAIDRSVSQPRILKLVERFDAVGSYRSVVANHDRLAEIQRDKAGELEIFCAHDAESLRLAQQRSAQ